MNKSVEFAVVVTIAVVGATIVGCNSNTAAEPKTLAPTKVAAGGPRNRRDAGDGMAAIERAAEAKKYLFALFWKEDDDQTIAMRGVLQKVMSEVTDRADAVEINVALPSERAIVDKFDLDRAPVPLILALAPNGAVIRGFPTKVDEQSLLKAFVTPCTAECMKSLQENKLVFLCVQNSATTSNDAAMEGVRQFKEDERFAQVTEILVIDPTDVAEGGFLKNFQIDPKTKEAVTVFLAPPSVPIGTYEGTTRKEELVAAFQKAVASCCSGSSRGCGGCGSGGCGSGGCGSGGCGSKK